MSFISPVTSQITYTASGTGAVPQSLTAKLRQIVNVRDYGAVGDGVTDDTSALQACYTANAGKTIDHGSGYTYIYSATLTLSSASIYKGKSALKAKANANVAGAAMLGTAVSNVLVTELEIDGNAANTGGNYGVWFNGGTGNMVDGVYVHDTIQAGMVMQSELGAKFVRNRLKNCGRNGFTDNHGIMAYSTSATPLKDCLIEGNYVDTAYRKGITTYNDTNGLVNGVDIVGNVVTGCGLGGIYVGSAPGAPYQIGVNVNANVTYANYVNIEYGNGDAGSVVGNIARADSGFAGIELSGSKNTVVAGNHVSDSSVHGIILTTSAGTNINLTVTGNTVLRSNTTSAGFGAGIYVNNTTASTIAGNTVTDDSGKMTHGVIEAGTSDSNVISGNNVRNATAANYTTVGASTAMVNNSTNKVGIGVATPQNNLHLTGGMTQPGQALALVNGANQNVALPSNAGKLTVTAPTAAYNIGGIAGGHDGRKLIIMNYTTQVMTLNHQDAGSTAANRFTLAGSANKAVPSFGAVAIEYDSTVGAWIVIG